MLGINSTYILITKLKIEYVNAWFNMITEDGNLMLVHSVAYLVRAITTNSKSCICSLLGLSFFPFPKSLKNIFWSNIVKYGHSKTMEIYLKCTFVYIEMSPNTIFF